MIQFPKHDCSLTLSHNENRDYYEQVDQYLAHFGEGQPSWSTPEQRARAIATNEIWELQWYPDTPIGSYHLCAPTLKELMEFVAAEGFIEASK